MNTWAITNKLFVCPIVTYWKKRYILESFFSLKTNVLLFFFFYIFPSFTVISYLISNFDTLINKKKNFSAYLCMSNTHKSGLGILTFC